MSRSRLTIVKQSSRSGHAVVMQWSRSGHAVVAQWSRSGHAVVTQWSCSGHAVGPKTKGHRKGPGVVDCVTKGHRKGHLVVECKSLLDIEVALVVPCRPAAGGVRVVAVGAAWPGSGWDCTSFRLGRGVSSGPRAWGVRLRAGVCWACVAAGSGFVVKPQASWALVGVGGRSL